MIMNKVIKTFLKWVCSIFLALAFGIVLLVLYVNKDFCIARNPEKIAAEADFELPDYTVVRQSDNMNRSDSAWSDYYWELKLDNPLADKDLAKLKKLVEKNSHWTYNAKENTYSYRYDGDGRGIVIDVCIHGASTSVTMDYNWRDFLS
jgi:hypothetical protein